VKGKEPAVVGRPVIAPVVEFKLRPVGRDPAMIEKVYVGTPPVATRDEEYATPTTPVDAAQLRASGTGGVVMVIPHELCTVFVLGLPDESTTCDVKENVPAVDGVPLISPVVGFRVRPGGKLPEGIENT
jgi:hypothetical protein